MSDSTVSGDKIPAPAWFREAVGRAVFDRYGHLTGDGEPAEVIWSALLAKGEFRLRLEAP